MWLGTDLSLSRQVAVKLLKPNLASDPVIAERFRREAVAVAQLNHPNIVAVYDAIEDNGRQAVVMQLVNGKSLRQLLDEQKKLSPDLTIHIGQCVAAALDAAHRAGMVHRDVKPGNILITPDGRVLLTDFGIAKGLEPTGDDLTNDNIMMGTAKYLSPEQVRGKRLDGRADLYSLGLVLYECLAGRVPFLGQNDADTALARLQRDPTDISSLRATLPPGLPELIHRLLARRPERRYATGAELRAALAAVAAAAHEPLAPDLTSASGEQRRAAIDPTLRTPPAPAARGPMASPVGPMVLPVRSGGRPAGPPVVTSQRDRTPTGPGRVAPRPNRNFEQRRAPSLMVVGGLLAAATVLAVVLWSTLGADGGDRFPTPTTAGAAAPPGEGAAPDDSVAAAGPVPTGQIVGVAAYDPDGDGTENDDQAARVLDGDPSTGWHTLCYSSEYLGGKGGVGLAVTLDGPSTGTLTVGVGHAPWILEVRATDADVVPARIADWGPAIASADGRASRDVGVEVTSPARHVLVLLRQLGPDSWCSSDNPYRGTLGEVRFTPTP